MILLLLSAIALLSALAGVSLLRLWLALPDRNVDFGLTPDDVDLGSQS